MAADRPAGARVAVTAHVDAADLARLDHMAARRGTSREALVAQAIDAMLAQEAWSGGFMPAPPPMEIPSPAGPRAR